MDIIQKNETEQGSSVIGHTKPLNIKNEMYIAQTKEIFVVSIALTVIGPLLYALTAFIFQAIHWMNTGGFAGLSQITLSVGFDHAYLATIVILSICLRIYGHKSKKETFEAASVFLLFLFIISNVLSFLIPWFNTSFIFFMLAICLSPFVAIRLYRRFSAIIAL